MTPRANAVSTWCCRDRRARRLATAAPPVSGGNVARSARVRASRRANVRPPIATTIGCCREASPRGCSRSRSGGHLFDSERPRGSGMGLSSLRGRSYRCSRSAYPVRARRRSGARQAVEARDRMGVVPRLHRGHAGRVVQRRVRRRHDRVCPCCDRRRASRRVGYRAGITSDFAGSENLARLVNTSSEGPSSGSWKAWLDPKSRSARQRGSLRSTA